MSISGLGETDLCVIGGGEAGFAAAIGGVALGLQVTLIDSGGLDPCWRNWDVALAVLRQSGRRAAAAGPVDGGGAFPRFRSDLEAALARGAPDRRFARLGAMNIRVLRGRAAFDDPHTVRIGSETLRARRVILATGAMAATAQQGSAALLLTLDRLRQGDIPSNLVVEGDARSLALAQGLRRLGVAVTVRAPDGLLPGVDAELSAALLQTMRREGVRFDAAPASTDASHDAWFYAAPGRPALSDLALDRAGIAAEGGGLVLSPALRTTNPRVYAVGGAAGARSSQAAQAQVGVALRSAFLRLPVRYDATLTPMATVTDPAIATVGLSEAEAPRPVTVWRWSLAETAAGAALGSTGHVKVVADKRGTILGASVVAADAAEQIGLWAVAVRSRMNLSALADLPLPVPALAEASRRVALLHAAQRLQSPWLKRALSVLARLG